MGYFEHTITNRAGWKYTHTGQELAAEAQRLHDEAFEKEMLARKEIARLMEDPQVGHDSDEVRKAKSQVEQWGKQREECAVFTYEFSSNLEREFQLALGDVVFFGLAPLLIDPEKK